MKKIYYVKEGCRYKPVAEYDSDLIDSFHKGTHIVMCYPGGQSRRYNIDANYAAMIAAGRVAEDAISRAIMAAGELRMQRRDRETPMTPGQLAAWEKLVEEFGDSAKMLERPSVRECAEAGVAAMQTEADKLMQHEAVRKAFDQFLLVCELTKNAQNR